MELLKSYRRLPISIEKGEDGIYTVSCAALGFCAYGQSIEEGLGNFEQVVAMCLAAPKASVRPY